MEQLCTHPNVGGVLLVSLGCEGFDRTNLEQVIRGTGRPADVRPAAWAFAPSAALADALSTSFMVMCEDEVATYCTAHAEVSAVLACDGPEGVTLARFGMSGA